MLILSKMTLVSGVDFFMHSEEEYFLSFLKDINLVAANSAKKMEELLFEYPSSAIREARVFAEEILNGVFRQDQIDAPYLSTFFEKVSYLSREGYIKKEIQHSFDTIRISGNKAAHDGQFNDITEAFKLHKEMYKIAVWFYEVYSLEHLKIPLYETPKPKQKENIKDIVKKQLLELLGTGQFELDEKKQSSTKGDVTLTEDKEKNSKEEDNFQPTSLMKDLPKGESYLMRELSRLKDSSLEAIENASQFSDFKDYLHVDRKIQIDLEKILKKNNNQLKGNLILLCGSVGDGKSHLLAYLKEKKNELIKDYTIFNDATESFSPNKNAMETLEEVLCSFSDQQIDQCNEKIILAINMGVLHNFINFKHKKYTFNILKEFVNRSDLFSQNITTYYSDNNFDLLSFGDYHSYELTRNGPQSSFYLALLQKICANANDNPFYLALKADLDQQVYTMIHENFKLLQNEFVQEQIVQLVIQTMVKKKLVISARAFLNFVADILIPKEIKAKQLLTEFEVLESSLPNLLFNRRDRSPILQIINQLDPIHYRSEHIDQLVIELNTLEDWETLIVQYVDNDISKDWLKPFISRNDLTDFSFNLFFESFIRITFLTNKKFVSKNTDKNYMKFLEYLYYFNIGDRSKIREFYEEIKGAIFKWRGSPKKDYIYMNKPLEKHRLAQKLNLRPTIEHLKPSNEDILDSFKSSIVLAYYCGSTENKIFLDIDYPLYSLLSKVQDGYRPNKKDEEDAIKFVEFIEKIMSYGNKSNEILIHFPKDNKFYKIKRDDFGAFVFEREY